MAGRFPPPFAEDRVPRAPSARRGRRRKRSFRHAPEHGACHASRSCWSLAAHGLAHVDGRNLQLGGRMRCDYPPAFRMFSAMPEERGTRRRTLGASAALVVACSAGGVNRQAIDRLVRMNSRSRPRPTKFPIAFESDARADPAGHGTDVSSRYPQKAWRRGLRDDSSCHSHAAGRHLRYAGEPLRYRRAVGHTLVPPRSPVTSQTTHRTPVYAVGLGRQPLER